MSDGAATNKRGVLYIFWGEKAEQLAQRSIRSVQLHHPELSIHCHRITSAPTAQTLREKSRMASITPFQTTLFLDVDTVVLGRLDYAFEQAERFGLACAINECPWMLRYGQPDEAEHIEYNTGVLFFSRAADPVFEAWQKLGNSPSTSHWTTMDNTPRGLPYDDQAGFARAIRQCNFNPFVLPLNYNFRPSFFRSAFAPVKIWHDYGDPPPPVAQLSIAVEAGRRPTTYFEFVTPSPAQPPTLINPQKT